MVDKNEMDAIIDQVYKDLKEHGYVTKETADELKRLEQAQADYNKKLALGGRAVSALADAGMAAASAMYDGKKGAAAFNSSVDSMADAAMAAGAALTLMIPGGPVIKAFVAGMTLAVGGIAKMYKASAEMADSLNTGFQKLSKSGGAASDGLTGIYGDLQKLGLGVQDLDGYVNMINDSSRDLALFGGSVFAGRKAFADIGKAMEPFREQLYNAGLSQEQVNAGTMSYIKLQARLGYAQSQSTQQLAEGAKKYLIEQDALTKLTGQTRQETEDARQSALQEEQFRAKLRQMELAGNKEGADRLSKYNDLMTAINPELGKGIRALSTGNLVAAESQQLLLSSAGQAAVDLQKVMDGTLPLAAAADSTAKAIGKFSDEVGVNLGVLKANKGVFMDLAATQDIRIAQEKGFEKTLAKIEEDRVKQGIDGGKAADALQQAQTTLRLKQLDAMQAAQDFVAKGMMPATKAAIAMTGATDNTVSALNKLVDTILKLVDDITNSSVVKYFTGANDRDKTSEEKEAQQRVEAAKVAYEKAFAGVSMFDPKRFGIGTTKAQDAADREYAMAQREADRTTAEMNKKFGTTKQSATAAGMPSTGTTAAPAGAPSGSQPSARTAPAPVSGGITAQDLAGAGLQIRGYGDVQAAGQVVSPALIEVAKKIQNSVQGFQYFSGFNDNYHHKHKPDSQHTKGLALDFVVKDYTPELGQQIVSQLKSLGASKVRDEYKNPSDHATGPHFHVEIPKFGDGGISPGPQLAMVGEKGPEAHVPLKGGSIPVTIDLDAQTDNKKNQLLTDNTKALLDMAASVTTGSRDTKISITDVENQPNNGKKTTDIDSVLASMETAFKNQEAARKQNVSISLTDATAGNFLGTGNEFTGPNVGPLTTDMAALKDIAAKLGAYDAQNEIITNPNTWKDIIKSGMLQNYDVGMANIGSRMIGDDAGNILGERVKEVMESNKVDVNTALTQTAKEFKDAMLQIVTQMQQQKDPEVQAQMVEHLAAISRGTASTAKASERMAAVASN